MPPVTVPLSSSLSNPNYPTQHRSVSVQRLQELVDGSLVNCAAVANCRPGAISQSRRNNAKRKKEAESKLENAWEGFSEGKLMEDFYTRLRSKYEGILSHCTEEEVRLR